MHCTTSKKQRLCENKDEKKIDNYENTYYIDMSHTVDQKKTFSQLFTPSLWTRIKKLYIMLF